MSTTNVFCPHFLLSLEPIYKDYTPYAKHSVYYAECFKASSLARMAAAMKPLYDAYEKSGGKKLNEDTVKKYITEAKKTYRATVKEFNPGTEKDLFTAMTKLYYDSVPKTQLPDIYAKVIFNKNNKSGYHGKSYADYTAFVFAHTFLADSNKFNAFCKAPSLAKLKNDAAVEYALSYVNNYTKNYQPKVEAFTMKKAALSREYVRELLMENKGKLAYPDANSTMRISYGQVLGCEPLDGVHYKYFTTMDGLMAKYKPGNDEFDVPKDLISLYKDKDYGRWVDADGTLHTDFMTNNDITGGNSGSPVINSRGQLMGAAFDGNWEAMSGDIAFDQKYKRTIVCDIRFILFVVDKMGHADNLIKEMDIRN